MPDVDQRILGLKFDNAQFEQAAQKSMNTIKNLKNSLSFLGDNVAASNLTDAFKNITFKTLNSGLDTVTKSFSFLEQVGIGVARRLGESIEQLGEKLIRNLGFAQISAGWTKYGEITQSIQTMVAATGKSVEEITGYMNKLNWFSDETSYSLTDMTSNIAKFTSAGIELDNAVNQMMGIAAASALAGSGIQNASHAMSGFSKAMAAGYMSTINWNWIQTARMDTLAFKQSLIDAAVEVGTLRKSGDRYFTKSGGLEVKAESLRETLNKKWMTTAVMEKALSVYGEFSTKLNDFYTLVGEGSYYTTNDILDYIKALQEGTDITSDLEEMAYHAGISVEELTENLKELGSEAYKTGRDAFTAAQEAISLAQAWGAVTDAISTGWMKTFELIFGNYEEAKKLWTDLSNFLLELFAEGGYARNDLLSDWHFTAGGGYNDFMSGISNMMDAIISFRDIIRETFGSLLPDITVNSLTTATDKFKRFTDNLTTSINSFKKIIGMSNEVEEIESEVEGETTQLVEGLIGNTGKTVSELIKKSIEVVRPDYASRRISFLEDKGIFSVDPEYTKNFFDAIATHQKYNLPELVKESLFGTEGAIEVPKFHSRSRLGLPSVVDVLQDQLTGESYGAIYSGLLPNGNVAEGKFHTRRRSLAKNGLPELVKEGLFEPGSAEEIIEDTDKITRRYENLWDILKGIRSTGTIIKNTVELAWGAIKTAFEPVKSLGDDFLELFGAIGRRITKISEDLVGNGSMLRFFRDLGTDGAGFIGNIVEWIRKLVKSLTELIDPEIEGSADNFLATILEALEGLWGGIKTLVDTLAPFISSFFGLLKELFDGLKQMVSGFFGNVDWSNFNVKLKDLLDIGILGLIASFFKKLNDIAKVVKVKGFGSIFKDLFKNLLGDKLGGSASALTTGITKIGEALVNVTTSLNRYTSERLFKEFANGILKIAIAFLVLALIPADKLKQATTIITGLLASFTFMFFAFGKMKGVMDSWVLSSIGTAIAGIGTGLLMVAAAMFVLALIPEKKIDQGLHVITVILLELSGMLLLLKGLDFKGILGAGVAILLIAAAIDLIAVAFIALAFIPEKKLLKAAGVLGAALVVIGLVVGFLAKSTFFPKRLLGAAAAILIVAAAFDLMAVALIALSFVNGEGLITGVVSLLVLIVAISVALGSLSTGNTGGMVAVAAAMLILAPAILIFAAALAVLSILPFWGLVAGLVALCATLAAIVIAAYMVSPVIPALFALAASFISISVGAALLTVELVAVGAIVAVVVLAIAGAITMILGALTELVYAIRGTVRDSSSEAEGGGEDISTSLLEGLKNAFSLSIGDVVTDLIDGLKAKISGAWERLKEIGRNIWNGLKNGLESGADINSPSKEMAKEMGYMIAGLGVGVDQNYGMLKGIGSGLADALISSTSEGLSEFDSLSPYVSPVLDMTNAAGGDLSFGATLTPSAVRSLGSVSADIRDQRESMNDYIDTAVQSAIEGMKDQLTFVVPLEVDGYQFAKSTAKFTRDAQNLLDRNALRKGGYTS